MVVEISFAYIMLQQWHENPHICHCQVILSNAEFPQKVTVERQDQCSLSSGATSALCLHDKRGAALISDTVKSGRGK